MVTASQDSSTNYSYYLLVFESLAEYATVKCTVQDTSTATSRYNLFVVTETSSANTTGGQISFEDVGDYKYEIYGKWTNDLTIPNTTALLESGYARVDGINYTYNSVDSDYDNIGYDPDAQ